MVKSITIVYGGLPVVNMPEILYEEDDKTTLLISSQKQGDKNMLLNTSAIYSIYDPILGKRKEIATYVRQYKVEVEGIITPSELYPACQSIVHGLKELLRFEPQGRRIPSTRIVCPPLAELERELQQCVDEFLE